MEPPMRPWAVIMPLMLWHAAARPAVAQEAAASGSNGNVLRRAIAATRLSGPAPSIDGRLDEAVWNTASPAADFVQQRPQPGAPPTPGFETEARVLYDDRAIYVAIRANDPAPDSLAATLGRRDFTGYSDWVQVVIDSYRDRRTAFRFAVNPAGVKKDVFHSEDFNEDIGWDAVWEARAAVDSAGWTAEFRIPLSQLRYAGHAGEQSWGINFQRDVARRNERTWWQPILPLLHLRRGPDRVRGLAGPLVRGPGPGRRERVRLR
jgi:hypothetical protein